MHLKSILVALKSKSINTKASANRWVRMNKRAQTSFLLIYFERLFFIKLKILSSEAKIVYFFFHSLVNKNEIWFKNNADKNEILLYTKIDKHGMI